MLRPTRTTFDVVSTKVIEKVHEAISSTEATKKLQQNEYRVLDWLQFIFNQFSGFSVAIESLFAIHVAAWFVEVGVEAILGG